MSEQMIYHMCKSADWQAAMDQDTYRGSGDDLADGLRVFPEDIPPWGPAMSTASDND